MPTRFLAAGNAFSFQLDFDIDPVTYNLGSGQTFYLFAQADPLGTVRESDEEDNARGIQQIAPVWANLETSSVEFSDGELFDDNFSGVSVTIKNSGGTVANDFRVAAYLSDDLLLDAEDYRVASREIVSLNAGTSLAVDLDFGLNPDAYRFDFSAGQTLYLLVNVDTLSRVQESNEEDNVETLQQVVPLRPNLKVAGVALSDGELFDDDFSGISVTIENSGGTIASDFRVGIYLSHDSSLGLEDTLVAHSDITSLGAGDSLSFNTDFDVDPHIHGISVGQTVYFFVKADTLDDVLELTKADNIESLQQVVPPLIDLGVLSMSVGEGSLADHLVDGDEVEVTFSVLNSGIVDSGGFRVGVYISQDAVLSESDRLVGHQSVESLVPGGSEEGGVVFNFDPRALGLIDNQTFHISVKADDLETLLEADETNNTFMSPAFTPVFRNPDLVVNAVSLSDGELKKGEVTTLTYEIENIGSRQSTMTSVNIFLVEEATFNGLENAEPILVARQDLSPLASGSSIVLSRVINTDSLDYGVYYVRVIPDPNNQIGDSNPDNNGDYSETNPLSLSIVRSDLFVDSLSVNLDTWNQDDVVAIQYRVQNTATASFTGINLDFYLSTDATIARSDVRIGSEILPTVPALRSVSGSYSLTVDRAGLDVPEGSYFLGAIVGSDDDPSHSQGAYVEIKVGTGVLPPGVVIDTTEYNGEVFEGRWSWRGTGENVGADGPRGVGVHAWGTRGLASDFETGESYRMGIYTGFSGTTSDTWASAYDDGDPVGGIGARDAYALGLTGAGVKVAVVDSSILATHSDLNDNFLHSYDISGGQGSAAPGDHGTHVAGIIAAEKNGRGMHGIAFDADLIGLGFGTLGNGALAYTPDAAADGIARAVADGARIFNNSWGVSTRSGNTGSPLDITIFRAAVADAIAEGSVFVWAAGNSYSQNTFLGDDNTSQEAKAALEYEELADGFVNVVNVDWDDENRVWTIANATGSGEDIGSQICGVTRDYCLAAPGTYISSTVANGGYESFSGTSMAAPMVSGGLAILFQAFPYVETSDILELVFSTTTDLGEEGVDSVYGNGMMNLAAALQPSGTASIPSPASSASVSSASTTSARRTSAAETLLIADISLAGAVSRAASEMIMLDSYDRAFVVGDAGIRQEQDLGLNNAMVLADEMKADFDTFVESQGSLSRVASTSEVLLQLSDQLDLSASGQDRLHVNAVAKDGAGSAEFQYVSLASGHTWQASRSVGLLEEQGQLFGNQGSGAYALVDRATTISLGTNAKKALGNQNVTLFGGISLNRTRVEDASNSLIRVSDDLISTSAVLGVRRSNLGRDGRGSLAVQIGQDRRVISGEGSIYVPVGRESDGIILFEESTLSREDLSLQPEIKISYSTWRGEDMSYALSAVATSDETSLAVDLEQAF